MGEGKGGERGREGKNGERRMKNAIKSKWQRTTTSLD